MGQVSLEWSNKIKYSISLSTLFAQGYTKPEKVKELLQDPNIDPSVMDNYAITWAAEFNHLEIVQMLLKDPRVDPSAKNNYAIRWACKNRYAVEIVKLLLADPRVDPAVNGNTPLRNAEHFECTEIIKLLKKHPKVKARIKQEKIVQKRMAGWEEKQKEKEKGK